MPYNSRPTSIPSYRIEETETDNDKTPKNTVQKPVPKTKEDEEKERIRSAEERFYNQFPNDGTNGVVFGTAPIANKTAPVDGNVKVSAAHVNVPIRDRIMNRNFWVKPLIQTEQASFLGKRLPLKAFPTYWTENIYTKFLKCL